MDVCAGAAESGGGAAGNAGVKCANVLLVAGAWAIACECRKVRIVLDDPHPSPPPEYRERGQEPPCGGALDLVRAFRFGGRMGGCD